MSFLSCKKSERGIICALAMVCLLVVMNLGAALFRFSFLLQKATQAIPEGLAKCSFQNNGPVVALAAFLESGQQGTLMIDGTACGFSGFCDAADRTAVTAVAVWATQKPQWGKPCRLLVSWIDPDAPLSGSTHVEEPAVSELIILGCELERVR